jgi:hypothetical protein
MAVMGAAKPMRSLSASEKADARAAFEHWFSDEGQWPQAVQRSGEGYSLAQAQSSWTTWQAATAAALSGKTVGGAAT